MQFRLTSLFIAAALLNALAQKSLCSHSVANVGTDGGTIANDSGTFFANADHQFSAGTGVYTETSGRGSAQAGFGHVNALAEAFAGGVPGASTRLVVESDAASIFEININSPIATAGSIMGTVHFHISGALAASGHGGDASVSAEIVVGGGSASGTAEAGPHFQSSGFFGENFNGGTGIGGIDIPVHGNLPIGVAFVSMSLLVTASAGQNGEQPGPAAFGISAFFSTLSFATDRPVFDLPEGYTVNSVSANIVDNRWLGDPVPEPTSAFLALIAAAGSGAAAFRRKRR